MSDVFISYAREDESTARLLATSLESRGWSVWWDLRIPYGKDFNAYLQQQLDQARCIIVLWSATSIRSQFVRDEATEGLNGRLVPVVIDGAKPPLGFRQIHTADLKTWKGEASHAGFIGVVNAITTIVPATPQESPTAVSTAARVPAPIMPPDAESDPGGDGTIVLRKRIVGHIVRPGRHVEVAADCRVEGSIHARFVVIFGQVLGPINATEKIDVRDGGVVDGDITAPRVAIAEGGNFKGKVHFVKMEPT